MIYEKAQTRARQFSLPFPYRVKVTQQGDRLERWGGFGEHRAKMVDRIRIPFVYILFPHGRHANQSITRYSKYRTLYASHSMDHICSIVALKERRAFFVHRPDDILEKK
jgi:hypothetical protein